MSDYSESKKVRNWKAATTSSPFKYDGVDYEIDARSALATKILYQTLEQITVARKIHKRLLVMRFDLRSTTFKNSNKEISLFRKRIVQWIERHYQTHSIGTLWVRERETVKHQHYHFAIWIDGNKIKHSRKLKLIIQQKWEEADPSSHAVWNCENGAYFVDNDGVFHDAVFRLSYLAKLRGKGYRDKQDNDYSTSRLRLKK